MKRLAVIFLAICFFDFPCFARADAPALALRYIYDDADVLDSEEQRLGVYGEALEQAAGVRLVIWTLESLEDLKTSDAFPWKGETDAVLLYIAKTHDARLICMRDLGKALNELDIERLIARAQDGMSWSDYDKSLSPLYMYTCMHIASKMGAELCIPEGTGGPGDIKSSWEAVFLAAAGLFIVAVFICGRIRRYHAGPWHKYYYNGEAIAPAPPAEIEEDMGEEWRDGKLPLTFFMRALSFLALLFSAGRGGYRGGSRGGFGGGGSRGGGGGSQKF